jgi:hypothetical protein
MWQTLPRNFGIPLLINAAAHLRITEFSTSLYSLLSFITYQYFKHSANYKSLTYNHDKFSLHWKERKKVALWQRTRAGGCPVVQGLSIC